MSWFKFHNLSGIVMGHATKTDDDDFSENVKKIL